MSAASRGREANAGARPPRVGSLRLVGPAAKHARERMTPPFGATLAADAAAYAVALGPADAADLPSVARALPDPEELPPGTLLFVLPAVVEPPSLAGRFLAALGRGRIVSRELRSTALVARGYVRVAAGVDRDSRSDLAWGYAPGDPGA